MATDFTDIEKGMDVYASDGEELGRISHIWADDKEPPTTSDNCLQVTEGGFLGLGETTLYVPLSAVETVVPGESVTLNCGKERCMSLYGTKPEFVKQQEEEARRAQAAVTAATTPVIFH